MKKVIILINSLKFGGMERVALIASNILSDKYDITIVTLYQSHANYILNGKNYNLNVPPKEGKVNKFFVALKRIGATKKMKKKLKPDVVISFGMYSNYMNALTKKNEKIIMGVRSYDWFTKPFFTNSMDKFIVSKFDSVNSVSKLISYDIAKYWKIKNNKSRIIYNPYDINLIQQKAKEKLNDFNFNKKNFYYISVGRLSSQKAFHHLIKAFSIVHNKYLNTKLIILGNGEFKEKLNELIKDLGLNESAFLLGGKDNPYKYINNCQAYVLSSLSEGFPNAMVEAMALGIPIVATDCDSGPREILAPSTNIKEKCKSFSVEEYGILVPEVTKGNIFSYRIIEECDIKMSEGLFYIYKMKNKEFLSSKSKEYVRKFNYDLFKKKMIEEIEDLYI